MSVMTVTPLQSLQQRQPQSCATAAFQYCAAPSQTIAVAVRHAVNQMRLPFAVPERPYSGWANGGDHLGIIGIAATNMKRIYLDQNIWVELAKAKLGSKDAHPRFEDAYYLAKRAVELGLASFVLSQTHLYETQKKQGWDSRLDIVELMAELSKLHTIKHVTAVVPLEVDYAIQTLTGQDPTVTTVFGVGVASLLPGLDRPPAHVDGFPWEELGYRRSFVETLASCGPDRAWDLITLAGARPGTDPDSDQMMARLRAADNQFATGQAELASVIRDLHLSGRDLEVGLAQYTLLEIRHELIRAALACGTSADLIVEYITGHAMALLQSLPSRWTVHAMYLQHAQPQKRWKPNDLHDFTALSIAVPYCDAVATEKHWTHMLKRRHIDETFGTVLIASPQQLVDYLAAL
ncbi:hypothetical protein [Mycobacterium sp. DL440]|uniref:hypothetical protein n=1 Tax=Mycobacterium sp. DL440 TaxID=2675523 RepID=UPI0014249FB6|nr:hypothetical protein [Mycobacterium sp. DL440]